MYRLDLDDPRVRAELKQMIREQNMGLGAGSGVGIGAGANTKAQSSTPQQGNQSNTTAAGEATNWLFFLFAGTVAMTLTI